jgi:hypothetical protein
MTEGFLITVAQEYSRPAIGYGALVPLATVAGREPAQTGRGLKHLLCALLQSFLMHI